jgi:hypothetical protein
LVVSIEKLFSPFYRQQSCALIEFLLMCLPRTEITTALATEITLTLFDCHWVHEKAGLAGARSRLRSFALFFPFDFLIGFGMRTNNFIA